VCEKSHTFGASGNFSSILYEKPHILIAHRTLDIRLQGAKEIETGFCAKSAYRAENKVEPISEAESGTLRGPQNNL
jgi:hypothetical protein